MLLAETSKGPDVGDDVVQDDVDTPSLVDVVNGVAKPGCTLGHTVDGEASADNIKT